MRWSIIDDPFANHANAIKKDLKVLNNAFYITSTKEEINSIKKDLKVLVSLVLLVLLVLL